MILTQAVPQLPLPPEPMGHMGLSDPAAVAIVVAILFAVVLITWPLIRALARRLEGGTSKELLAEVDALRARLQQLEEGQARLTDLEERLDFAERMLAQSREQDRLPR